MHYSLQVMKMLMPLLSPASGKINFQLPEGAVLVSGDLIARLDLDDCNSVTAAQPYPGGFPELGPPLVHSQGVDYRFKEAYSAAKMILEGMLLPLILGTLAALRQYACELASLLAILLQPCDVEVGWRDVQEHRYPACLCIMLKSL